MAVWSAGGFVCALIMVTVGGASFEKNFPRFRVSQSSEREYLVHVNGQLDGSIHGDLQARGATVTGYLGNGRLLVYGSEEAIGSLEKVARVEKRHVVFDKIPQRVAPRQEEADYRRGLFGEGGVDDGDDSIQLNVNLVNIDRSDENEYDCAKRIMAIVDDGCDGCNVKKVKKNCFRVTLSPQFPVEQADIIIRHLTASVDVSSVEVVERDTVHNEEAQSSTRGSSLHDSSLINLSGEGEIVGVADSGLDYDMCFFRDDNEAVAFGSGSTANFNHRKIVQYSPYVDAREGSQRGHGTHVCGSIAGQSLDSTYSEYDGMAPSATIAFFDLSYPGSYYLSLPFDTYNDLLMDPYLLGARLHSNSWGNPSNAYTTRVRDFDQFMYDHEDFLILCSAGNRGADDDGTIGDPGGIKNGLTVGASGNLPAGVQYEDRHHGVYNEMRADFSGTGPTSDGRLKPDVLAPGDRVTSAASDASINSNNCGVGGKSGTSMSTPITTGTAALVREYYSAGYYPSGNPNPSHSMPPSSALVKATLIHSAQAVYGMHPAPSFTQGYGRVNLENVLLGADNQADFNLYVEDSIQPLETGDVSAPLCFQVQDTQDFKVTLVWTDKPGEVNSDHALVNDLTLSVVQEDESGGYITTQGNHRFNQNGAELIVGGVGVEFGYTTLGATLDITPPVTAQESIIGNACDPLDSTDVAGNAFVHNDAAGNCTLLEAATNAQSAGAVAMVVATERYELLTVFDGDVPSTITIPVVTTNHLSAFSAGSRSVTARGSSSSVALGVQESGIIDGTNNVEQVRVRHNGLVSVLVLADEVATPVGQKYALVITGDFVESTVCPEPECPLCLNGDCVDGECQCKTGWAGIYCGLLAPCLNGCSGHGECTAAGCVCDEGYRGEDCGISHCGGTVILTGSSGTITHDVSGQPYQNYANCRWKLIPEDPNTNIRFSWGTWDVKLEYGDYLFLLDGAEASYSSSARYLLRPAMTGDAPAEEGIFSTFYGASVWFLSSSSGTDAGFKIQWEALTCLNDCNGAGTCPEEPESDGTCECDDGYSGPGCGVTTCTESTCLNGGVCMGAGVCQCPLNWFGERCERNGQCDGMAVYTADVGEFGDGSGDRSYASYLDCGFYVEPSGGASSIEFSFEQFSLQRVDFLYVYDDLQRTNLLLTLNGDDLPAASYSFGAPSLYFQFVSNYNFNSEEGFKVVYLADSYECVTNCVNGECVDNECQCDIGWAGFFCTTSTCPSACSGHGTCGRNGCECTPGYYGEDCSETHCRGEVTLTGNNGTISHDMHAGSYYENNAHCVWWFIPEDPNTNIRFSWGRSDVHLESGYDYLYFLDGVGPSPLMRGVTGYAYREEELTSYSPVAGVVFTSDYSATYPGFTIHWEALACTDDCNGAGTCPEEPESDGTCECEDGYSGPGCGVTTCTESTCLNGGVCTGAGVCQCPLNWFGERCERNGQCDGMAVYTAPSGEFGDGSGGSSSYANLVSCGFYVEPEVSGIIAIEFAFGTFDLEADKDFLYVYDDLQQTNLLMTLTGDSNSSSNVMGTNFEFDLPSLYFQFITDSYGTAGGFNLTYTSKYHPPVFTSEQYTFTFIGAAVATRETWWVQAGVRVGSISALDPAAGGDLTYRSLLRWRYSKYFSIEPNGDILVEEVPKSGRVYSLGGGVEACSPKSGLCSRMSNVTMVILNDNGCLDNGICPDSGPVFTPPTYRFEIEGGGEAEGTVVGKIQAVDPVYPNAVVRYEIPDGALEANASYRIRRNGDILVRRREKYMMKNGVFILPVVACSVSGCSALGVELVATTEKKHSKRLRTSSLVGDHSSYY